MSKIKEFFHDEITEVQRQLMEDNDLDRQYQEWVEAVAEEQLKEEWLKSEAKRFGVELGNPVTQKDIDTINMAIEVESMMLEQGAERSEFFRIYEITNTYPF